MCWPLDVIHCLFLAVDIHHKCCVSVTELKIIFTLISKLNEDSKLTMICEMEGSRGGEIEASKARCILAQLEAIVINDREHCQDSKEAINSKINAKMRDDKTISMVEFIEFSKSISELSALFKVMECNKVDCDEKVCRMYHDLHSPLKQSPNRF